MGEGVSEGVGVAATHALRQLEIRVFLIPSQGDQY